MKKQFIPFLLGSAVLLGTVACGNTTEDTATLSETPDATAPAETLPGETDPAAAPTETAPMEEGAAMGEGAAVSDTDIEAAVLESLQAQYPENTFEVESEAGNVTVSGDIATPEEIDAIRNQVALMPGVTSVEVMPSDAAM